MTWVAMAAVLLFGCARHGATPVHDRLPDIGPGIPLALHDAATGRPLLDSLRGKVVLVSFIDSTCRDACPITEKKFSDVQTLLAKSGYLGSRVQLVLVGIDPVEDTRANLARLAHNSGASSGAFHYAYGSPGEVEPILKAYGIKVAFRGSSHVDPGHTVALYLVDPSWHVRYDFSPAYPASTIARIAVKLVAQTVNAK